MISIFLFPALKRALIDIVSYEMLLNKSVCLPNSQHLPLSFSKLTENSMSPKSHARVGNIVKNAFCLIHSLNLNSDSAS